ncbi:MAG: peptide chain release factor N(5)-glutamine methyltransferase [Elusimicrobiota bacterium]
MKAAAVPAVEEAARGAAERLAGAGVENAAFEARQLAAAAAGLSARGPFPAEAVLSSAQRGRLEALLARRLSREPLAYVLGEWDFYGLTFRVDPRVLIPRPETEELAEWVLSETRDRGEGTGAEPLRLADVGTGSGCIAVCLAKFLPGAEVWATDVSSEALRAAEENAALHGVEGIRFRRGDLLEPLAGETLDAVVANLPYIPAAVIPGLDPEVLREPRPALDGGEDGLDLVRRLLPQALKALRPGGKIYLEVGHDQAARASALLSGAGFRQVRVKKDLCGVNRFLGGTK